MQIPSIDEVDLRRQEVSDDLMRTLRKLKRREKEEAIKSKARAFNGTCSELVQSTTYFWKLENENRTNNREKKKDTATR